MLCAIGRLPYQLSDVKYILIKLKKVNERVQASLCVDDRLTISVVALKVDLRSLTHYRMNILVFRFPYG